MYIAHPFIGIGIVLVIWLLCRWDKNRTEENDRKNRIKGAEDQARLDAVAERIQRQVEEKRKLSPPVYRDNIQSVQGNGNFGARRDARG